MKTRALFGLCSLWVAGCKSPSAAAPTSPAPAQLSAVSSALVSSVSLVPAAQALSLSLPTSSQGSAGVAPNARDIVLRGDQLFVDGEPAGDVRQILATQRLSKIDRLLSRLTIQRDAWRAARPDDAFNGEATLWFDGATSLLVFKSAFQTAAFAGYPVFRLAVQAPGGAGRAFLSFSARLPLPSEHEMRAYDGFSMHVIDSQQEGRIRIAWKSGSYVEHASALGEDEGPATLRLTLLAERIGEQWRRYGGHQSEADRAFDQAVVHLPNNATLQRAVQVLDAICATQRDFRDAGTVRRVPAFSVTFAVD